MAKSVYTPSLMNWPNSEKNWRYASLSFLAWRDIREISARYRRDRARDYACMSFLHPLYPPMPVLGLLAQEADHAPGDIGEIWGRYGGDIGEI